MNRSFIVMLLCLMPLWTFAQEDRVHKSDQERRAEREAVQAQKIAFITQETGLTPAEAEKFWPLYNEMNHKVGEVIHKRNDTKAAMYRLCLLYTSDAADDLLCVDLGGRRIIKKKKYTQTLATGNSRAISAPE